LFAAVRRRFFIGFAVSDAFGDVCVGKSSEHRWMTSF